MQIPYYLPILARLLARSLFLPRYLTKQKSNSLPRPYTHERRTISVVIMLTIETLRHPNIRNYKTYPPVATSRINFDEFCVVAVLIARGIDGGHGEIAVGGLVLLVRHRGVSTHVAPGMREIPNVAPAHATLKAVTRARMALYRHVQHHERAVIRRSIGRFAKAQCAVAPRKRSSRPPTPARPSPVRLAAKKPALQDLGSEILRGHPRPPRAALCDTLRSVDARM